jgi:manganese/iron transport system ATP-binding protein
VSAAPALDACDVDVELSGRRVLEQITLSVRRGELVGLIGPNGAGKTTLLRAVLGLVPLTAGAVALAGEPPARMRGAVGYVPQRHEFAWDFPASVEQAVLSGRTHRIGWLRRARAADRAAVERALARVDMLALRARPIGELSGGQRQRVLVARALALEPGLLLLDEPFAGLDVPTQELLSALFAVLRAEGAAVVMTTHDLPHAAELCDRLVLLNRTVVADGEPAELRDPVVWLRAFGVSDPSRLIPGMAATA